MATTVIAVAAVAAAAVLAFALLAFASARANARSDRRLQTALGRIGDSMDVLSQSLLTVVEGAEVSRTPGRDLGLTLDLGELLQQLALTATRLVAADGAAVSVVRERGEPATATYGLGTAETEQEGLEPPDNGPWRAVTVQWTPVPGAPGDAVRSALAVPIEHDGGRLGTICVYTRAAQAFAQEHADALVELSSEAAPAIANARLHEATVELVRTDAMTGFRNRRGYDEALEAEIARARRGGRPLTILLLDIDLFSSVNGRFGYQVGDRALVAFTESVALVARASDVLCRRGGDEFVVILPDTECREGVLFDARLRGTMAATEFPTGEPITYSAGLTELRDGDDAESLDERIGRLVMSAKTDGNRLVHDCDLRG